MDHNSAFGGNLRTGYHIILNEGGLSSISIEVIKTVFFLIKKF